MPSPYQRDLFRAINDLDDVELSVHYLESNAPDSPWSDAQLQPWEQVLPGWCLGRGRVRSHLNWGIPSLREQDVVIVNAALTDVTTQRLLRRRNKLAPNAKWLFWGELMRSGGGLAGKVRRLLGSPLNRLDGIVAIGNLAADNYRARFSTQTIFELPYFCELQPFIDADSNRRELDVDAPLRFLFCGQMIQRKGIDLLLQAFGRLIKAGQQVQLTLVGREASLPELMNDLAAEVKQNIDFLGFQDVEKLPEIFANADVFVLPSRHDGWGVVINQAIGAGLAIVSTDRVGAVADLVDDGANGANGVNGLVVPAGEVAALEKAMQRLATDRKLRQAMQSANRARRQELLPCRGADRWLKIFQEVVR